MAKNTMKRSLKTRHLSMIALGGSIGTGLFVASGSATSPQDLGALLVAYLGIGLMVFFLMHHWEMATYLPVTGSFCDLCAALCWSSIWFCDGVELLVQLGDHISGRYLDGRLSF